MVNEVQTSLFYQNCLLILYLIGPPTAITLWFTQAPYGRHRNPRWGPTIQPALAWFLMESPAVFLSLILFFFGRHHSSPRSIALISVFLFHYIHRTCVYPLRLHRRHQAAPKSTYGFPVLVALVGFNFNLLNSFLQARWVSHYGDYDSDPWFLQRFVFGLAIFLVGMAVNVWADMVLVGLKAQSGDRYTIPRGGLFELVSNPNYFGEILEWLGWVIMTWSWAGLGFLLYTCSNFVPRARAHRVWYVICGEVWRGLPQEQEGCYPFLVLRRPDFPWIWP